MKKIRTLLVDDQVLYRQCLKAMLASTLTFDILDEIEDGFRAIEQTRTLNPDLVIMNTHLCGIGYVAITSSIRKMIPDVKIVLLTDYKNAQHEIHAIRAGANAFIHVSKNVENLIDSIDRVMCGEIIFENNGVRNLMNDSRARGSSLSHRDKLSSRELQILSMICDGKQTKEIAFELNISAKTVDCHRYHIYEKTSTRCISELMLYAIRSGYMPTIAAHPPLSEVSGASPVSA